MSAMKRAPTCPKCGKAPPIRRATIGDSAIRITHRCGCGVTYEIATDELAPIDVVLERIAG
jgi:hypothetical protein